MNVQEMQDQIARNSAQWGNSSPDGQEYLHNSNLYLQAQIDAANNTVTTYDSGTGTYSTQRAGPPPPPPPNVTVTGPVQIVQAVKNGPVIVTTFNASSVTAGPTSSVSASTQAVVSEIDKRNQYAASFTGWDNDPTIRKLQTRDMDIYVSTGRWDTPEQLQLHAEAEAARKAINVTYKGSALGTLNKAGADALILPDNQPNVTGVSNSITGAIKSLVTGAAGATGAQTGGLIKAGLGVGAIFLVLSLFKGGR